MRRVLFLLSALALAAACSSHSSSSGSGAVGTPDGGGAPDAGTACKDLAAACLVPSDCCSGACNGTCVEPTQCKTAGGSCGADSDCCTNHCANGLCVEPAGSCVAATQACSTTSDCCSGSCVDDGAGHKTCGVLSCKAGGLSCASDGDCCSTTCAGGTCTSSTFCKSPSEQCSEGAECCSLSCVGGACAAGSCASVGETCIAGSQCCTGICDGTCKDLPVDTNTAACKTLGNSCTLASECCSKNCQGGSCVQAASCNTTGDICYQGADCCSGVCSHTDGTPGRCELMTGGGAGGCAQGGTPCDGSSNCCSRLCVDLGTGVKVCQPSGGCRMTGDYCDQTNDCCNLNSPPNPTPPQSYKDIACTQNRCDNGGGCNPPGNICGASTDVNASQNCCNGKKDVCKSDSNGILRCFGGPTQWCGANGCTGNNNPCPHGWDASAPECCIQPGDICQFRDQCCNGEACVPDASGVLRCGGFAPGTPGAPSCKPLGSTCADANDHTCCEPELTCQSYDERHSFFACLPSSGFTPSCKLDTGACTFDTASSCCSGACTNPDGSACASGDLACTCGSKTGASFCQASGASCTVSTDCCDNLACNVPAGQTSGTCGTAAAVCVDTGQTGCSPDVRCCNATDTCSNGTCAAPTCGDQGRSCALNTDCCSGQGLACEGNDSSGNLVPCGTGGATACSCQPQCIGTQLGDPCSASQPCCTAGQICSSATNGTCQAINRG